MGKVIMSGIVPQLVAPVTGIPASDLAVGSSVYLMENGSAVEYLVVNHGKPSGSSLYDDSCDGLWLLRKDIYTSKTWHNSESNVYAQSTTHTYLNETFFEIFGAVEQTVIRQAKIPYVNGTGAYGAVASGTNGLETKVFLLSAYEVGWTQGTTAPTKWFPIDGACLDYFSATSATDSKRIAYLNNTATAWWLRSPHKDDAKSAWVVSATGGSYGSYANSGTLGIRPALILPSTALFDEKNLILKGVA